MKGAMPTMTWQTGLSAQVCSVRIMCLIILNPQHALKVPTSTPKDRSKDARQVTAVQRGCLANGQCCSRDCRIQAGTAPNGVQDDIELLKSILLEPR